MHPTNRPLIGIRGGSARGFYSGRPQSDGWINARDLTGLGANPSALPAGTTPRRLAAWTAVSRVILNLDETITKE